MLKKLLAVSLAASLVAALTASGTLVVTMTAEEAIRVYEKNLRSAGIRLSPLDIKYMKMAEQQREKTAQYRRQLLKARSAYYAAGDKAKGDALTKEINRLQLVQKGLPVADNTVGGYYQDLRRYGTASPQKYDEYLQSAKKAIDAAAKDVEVGAGKEAAPAKPAGESNAKSGSEMADWVAYVISKSGEAEVFVNGQKVERQGQTFALEGSQDVYIRAQGLGDMRKRIRSFDPPANTTVLAQTDNRWHYRVSSGNFNGETDWLVYDESVKWNVSQQPNLNGSFAERSSNKVGAKKDVLHLKFVGACTIGASFDVNTKWFGDSLRPGGRRDLNAEDDSSGSVTIAVGPRE